MHTELSGYAVTVLDSVGDGVIVVSQEGLVTLMNPAAEEMTGRSRSQVLGTRFRESFRAEAVLVDMVERTEIGRASCRERV